MANANDLVIKRERQQLSDAFKKGRMHERNAAMMISKAHPPGELPPYVPPDKPSSPWEPGKSPAPSRKMMAHGEYFDDYGRIKKKPKGMTPSGKPFDMPVDKEQQKKNKERHDRLYHPDLTISQGPDYIGDKRTYDKLDRILNPLGNFKKPTLDQLRIHAANYPKV